MSRKLIVVDLLCGAGGSTTAAVRALLALGWTMDQIIIACLNHWQTAIDTHTINHPTARHYCQDIAAVRPHIVVPEGYVDLLLASPTCTHHSNARGGKPTTDQQRSDPWHILPWFTEVRTKCAIIENVWEFLSWGPVDHRTCLPIKARKGEYFQAWRAAILNLGATSFEYKKLNAANYGTAQTRQRFIAKICFDKIMIGWAPISHQRCEPGRLELFPTLKPWRPARDIIDWSIRGKSIFGRKKPLSWKSLDRLLAGILRFAWPAIYVDILLPELERSLICTIRLHLASRHKGAKKKRAKCRKRVSDAVRRLRRLRNEPIARPATVEQPQPMIVTMRQNADGRSIDGPLPTILAGGQHIALAEPFVISQASGGAPRSVSQPLPTAPTGGAHALIAPYYGSGSGETCTSAEQPLPTLTSKARFGIVMPITHNDGSDRARDINADPVPTITTAKRGELAFIAAAFGERVGQTPRTHSVDDPAPAVLASGRINLVEGRRHDILYRMFQPHELAAAMGFNTDETRYEFAGTKTEQIKQIGNAVPVEMMEAEIKATMAIVAPRRARVSAVEADQSAVA